MKTFAVCELQDHLTEIVRMVEKEGETIQITNHGEVIAHLVPKQSLPKWLERPEGDTWANLDRLSKEISAQWPEGVSAVDAIRNVRRDL